MRTTLAREFPVTPRDSAALPDDHSYYLETCKRFDRAEMALAYRARKNTWTARNRREWHCIVKALGDLPPGATVLDLPCGSGRLEPLLEQRGYRVTAADYSHHMVETARDFFLEQRGLQTLPDAMQFMQQDVMRMDFAANTFDAVICNRLLHHYPTSVLRQQVLRECARVSNGVVVISYFNNLAVSALRFHVKNALLSRTPTDRIPIWYRVLKEDLAAAGLQCTASYAVRFGLSPQTYLRLEPL